MRGLAAVKLLLQIDHAMLLASNHFHVTFTFSRSERRRLEEQYEEVKNEVMELTSETEAPFGTALGRASRAASREALPNVCFRTGFTRETGSEAVGGLHRQGEAMKSWLHAAYTSI